MPIIGPDNNPKTRVGGQNKLPMHLIPPRALAHVALAFADGGLKYQAYNWREEKISSSVYYGAALRHLNAWWEGENIAPDGVAHHLAHAICCMAMILDTMDSPMLNDNRPPAIGKPYSALLDELAAHLPSLKARENTKFDLHEIARATRERSDEDQEPVYQANEPVFEAKTCGVSYNGVRCALPHDHDGVHSYGRAW